MNICVLKVLPCDFLDKAYEFYGFIFKNDLQDLFCDVGK